MVYSMRDDYTNILADIELELQEIRRWINLERNMFDSKTRYLISYSVIRACGAIEVVFKRMIFDFLAEGAKEETKAYLGRMILDSSCNPNTGNMSNMLQSISTEWKEEFDNKVKGSGKKDKINSLVQLRNDFAHGDSVNVSIDTIITYFDAAKDILCILDDVVGA